MVASEIKITLLDDHGVLRDGLTALFEAVGGFSVVGSFACPRETSDFISLNPVNLLIMEMLFDEIDVFRSITEWTQKYNETRLIVLSQFPERLYAERVLNAGASGYLMKGISFPTLATGARQVCQGEISLSPEMSNRLLVRYTSGRKNPEDALDLLSNREMLVLTLIGKGYANAKIAETMGVSKRTVSTFKERIKEKLSLASGQQLAQIAVDHLRRAV